jgi:CRISPR-associated endonuclease/helicase Cas3
MRQRGIYTLHLSTALAPIHRERIVERVLEMLRYKDYKDWVLVATSCVEAGMNFSFRHSFRERASTASLIQVSGRTSRGAEYSDATVTDFTLENKDLITNNPLLGISIRVLGSLFDKGLIDKLSPSELAKFALKQELTEGDLEFSQKIKKAEKQMCYPEVANLCRVIEADTRTVIIDKTIVERVKANQTDPKGYPISPKEIQKYSVQMWTNKINSKSYPIQLLIGNPEKFDAIYEWTGDYDPDFLGLWGSVWIEV